MKDFKFNEKGQVIIEPPKKPKKITGTRLGAILKQNPWTTPFKSWCEITKTYEEPFADTKYTLAGKELEPKQLQYLKQHYMLNITTPADVYGDDYFNKTYGNFFTDDIFGGMWDGITEDTVIECKTTKRVEDWRDDIPEYYALQASLYAKLLNYNKVIFICNVLDEEDYNNIKDYKITPKNTIIKTFKVDERYKNFNKALEMAKEWWDKHIITGISPIPDETKDKEIINILKTEVVETGTDENIDKLLNEAYNLALQREEIEKELKPITEAEKKLKTSIKNYLASKLNDVTDKAIINNDKIKFTLNTTYSKEIDKEKLKSDGILEQYETTKATTRLTAKML